MKHSIQQGTGRKLLLIVVALIFALSLVLLTACSGADIDKIEVLEESIPTNVRVSEFDITQVTLKVIDVDGNESTVAATKNMLSTESKNALKTAGTHQITLYYQKKSVTFEVRLFADDAELVTVTFKDKNGTVIQTITTEKGGKIKMPDSPVVPGLIKDGWADALGTAYTNDSTIQKDLVLIARYKESITEHTVTFVDYQGNTVGTVTVPSGQKITQIPAYQQTAEVASYKWYYGNSELNIDNLTVRNNITITMQVTYVRYAVTFRFLNDKGQYETLDTLQVKHGDPASATVALQNLSNKGYAFIEWDKSFSNVRGELIVTATANLKTYAIIFKDFDGNIVASKSVAHGKALTEIPNSVGTIRTGYTFTGWDVANFSNITGNMEVNAVYELNKYQITVYMGNDPIVKDITYDSVINFKEFTENNVIVRKLVATARDGTVTILAENENSVLIGLFTDSARTNAFEVPHTVSTVVQLYTKWVDVNRGSENLQYSEIITLDNTKVTTVIGYTGNDKYVYIPDVYSPSGSISARVIGIADSAFIDNNDILGVYFGQYIESIGARAFQGSAISGTFAIPKSVKSIGAYAFEGCEYLTEVTFAAESELETIGEYAFSGAKKITAIVLPAMLKSIGASAFADMEALEEVVLSQSILLTELAENLLAGSEKLTTVSLPGTVTYISNGAFSGTGIASINLAGVVTVANEAFKDTLKLGAVSNTQKIKYIGEYAFAGSAIQSIALPAIISIERYAFQRATKLESVVIGKYLATLDSFVFDGCSALTDIDFQTGGYDTTIKLDLANIKIKDSEDAFAYTGNNAEILEYISALNTGISTYANDFLISLILDEIETNLFNRLGYTRLGWFADSDFETKLDFTSFTGGNVIVYAEVEKVAAPKFAFSFDSFGTEEQTADITGILTTYFDVDCIELWEEGMAYGELVYRFGSLEMLRDLLDEYASKYYGYYDVEWFTDEDLTEALDMTGEEYEDLDETITLYPSLPENASKKARLKNREVLDTENIDNEIRALIWGVESHGDEEAIESALKAHFLLQGKFFGGLFTDEEMTEEWDYSVGADNIDLYIKVVTPGEEKVIFERITGEQTEVITEVLIKDYIGTDFSTFLLEVLYDLVFDYYMFDGEEILINDTPYSLEAVPQGWPQEDTTIGIPTAEQATGYKLIVDLNDSGLGAVYQHIGAVQADGNQPLFQLIRQGVPDDLGMELQTPEIMYLVTNILNFFNYEVQGFYTDAALQTAFDPEAPLTADTRLFIKYALNAEPKVKVNFGAALDYEKISEEIYDSRELSLLYLLENIGITKDYTVEIFGEDFDVNLYYITDLVRKALRISDKAVEGFYTDAAFTNALTLDTWPESDATIYLKTVNIEKDIIGLEGINANAFAGSSALRTISLPATLAYVEDMAFMGTLKLTAFNVSVSNFYFRSVDGVLYETNGFWKLLSYPSGRAANAYAIAPITDEIAEYAFEYANIATLVIPAKISELGEIFTDSFIKYIWFEGDTNVTLEHTDFIKVYAYETSAALYEAVYGSEKVVVIGEETTIPQMYNAEYGLFYELGDATATVIGADRTRTSITVPAALGGKAVTRIGAYAFENSDELVSVDILATLISIGEFAFRNNTGLTDIQVTAIQRSGEAIVELNAFADTPWYQNSELVILAGIALEYKPEADDEGNYNYPENVVVPSGVKVLADGLFKDKDIKSVTLPASLEIIGAEAFRNTLITSIVIPALVTSIGNYAFADNTQLISADLTAATSVETLNEGVFSGAVRLAEVRLPVYLKTIGERAFENAISLARIKLPENLAKIEAYAFYGSGLITIALPSKVGDGLTADELAIGNYAFASCDTLVYVRVYNIVPKNIGENAFDSGANIYVNGSTGDTIINAYNAHAAWGVYYIRLEKDTPKFSFEVNKAEDSTTITDLNHLSLAPVTSAVLYEAPALPAVPGYIFMGWVDNAWEYVTFPIAITSNKTLFAKWATTASGSLSDGFNVTYTYDDDLGGYVLNNYRAASGKLDKKVFIPAAFNGKPIVAIGANAFKDLAVEEIVFAADSQVEIIMESAFENSAIKFITLPAGLKVIAENAFAGCASLTSVYIPSTVEEIQANAFSGSGGADIVFAEGSKLLNASVASFEGSKWYSDALLRDIYIIAGQLLIEYNGDLLTQKSSIATIPVQAKAIAKEVFMGNTDLLEVEFHSGVYYIGDSAFENCENLNRVDFGRLDISLIEFVGTDAFTGTAWLNGLGNMVLVGNVLKQYIVTGEDSKTVVLPDHITVIDERAFENTEITSIVLPTNLKTIGKNAFLGAAMLTSVTIPANVTQIGEAAFKDCIALEAVYFATGSKLLTIGAEAFAGCINLGIGANAATLTLPASVEEIGASAFKGCSALKKVDLSSTKITIVRQSTFENATALEEVKLSDIVVTLTQDAFAGCTMLETFTVPQNSALLNINISAIDDTAWYNRTPAGNEDYILIYMGSILLAYRQKVGISGNYLSVSVPAHIKYIADGAFKIAGGAFIGELLFTEGLLEIGANAFENLINLESLVLPDSLTKIGNAAFKGCSSLKNVEFGSGLSEIGANAFTGCQNLKTMYVKRLSYGVLSDDQIRDINTALNNLATNPNAFSEWYGANQEVFIGTAMNTNTEGAQNSIPTGLADLRIYVVNDSKSINIQLYKTVWSIHSDSIFHSGQLPTVTFEPIAGATQLAPVNTHLVTESMLQSNFAGHTLMGWEAKYEGGEYARITLPHPVYRNTTLRAIWLRNDREVSATLTDTELGFVYQYDTEAGGYYINRFDGVSGDTLVIPATLSIPGNLTVQKVKILGIRPNVFTEGNTEVIKKVIIVKDDNLAAFDINPFRSMINLESITVLGSNNLSAVDGVLYTKDMSTIIAYPAKKANTEYAIHDGTTTILTGAFTKTALTKLTIPASVVSVKATAFVGNNALANLVFATNSEITEVGATDTVNAFSGTKWFTDWVANINSQFISAGSYLLAYKGSNEVVSIPDGIKTIGNYAFYNSGYNNIEELKIPASVVMVNANAFTGSSGIRNMVFATGSNLVNVANGVFDNTMWMSNQQENNVEFVIAGKTLLKYNGSSMSVTVPATVQVIGYRAFQNKELTSITLHANIIRIDANAFYGTQNLQQVTIPAAVQTIGANAFYDNRALTSVTFSANSNLREIGENAFWNSVNLTAISIPDSVLKIGASAFENTTALKTLTINATSKLTDLGMKAFKASGITSVYIPNGLTEIKESTFEECTSLVTINFSDNNSNLRKIGKLAFRKCINLGSNLTNATTLITVVLPNRVTVIEENAFNECTGMYGIKLGEMVTSIGAGAFNGCYKLANITISASEAPTIYNESFGSMNPSYIAKRVYVNRSEDDSTIGSYVSAWGDRVTAVAKIVERGTTPKAIFVQMEGTTEVVLYQLSVEFLHQGNLPYHLSGSRGQAVSFYTDIMDPSGSVIATSAAPYYVLTEDTTKLYVNWSGA